MSSNSAQIVRQLRCDFQELIEYATGDQAQSRTAYEVELTLFRRLLVLGAKLLHLFFIHRAATRPSGPFYAPDGTEMEYHDLRPTTYFSVVRQDTVSATLLSRIRPRGLLSLGC
jgi:hypothetical protein